MIMNKYLLLASALLFLGTTTVSAQLFSSKAKDKTLKNGVITYVMDVQSTEPMAAALNNSKLQLAFSGSQSKMVGEVMGGVFVGDIILDGTLNQGLALLKITGQKKAIRMTDSDISKAQASTDQMSNQKIHFLDGTQQVAGYTCKKALIKDPSQPGSHLLIYVCEAIQPESGGLIENMMEKLNGFPLGFEIKSPEGTVKLMASEVSKKVLSKSAFSLDIPGEYEETSMEKLMEDMGGMMGK